jgi:hypothetical protein
VNASKTQAIYFSRCWSSLRLPGSGIFLNEQKVPWTPEVKYLGVTLDKRLTFASHTAKSIEKAERAFRILYSFLNRKSKLCLHNKLLLYRSCIRPILCYGVETYGLLRRYAQKKTLSKQVSQDNQKSSLAILDI